MAKTKSKAQTKNRERDVRTKSKRTSRTASAQGAEGWCLETVACERGTNRIALDRLPFRVGRREDLDLTLSNASISAYHAEFYIRESTRKLCIRDLQSTNGTFVNDELVRDAELNDGDRLHLADIEFRIRHTESGTADSSTTPAKQTLQLGRSAVRSKYSDAAMDRLLELIRKKSIAPVFQPIVRLPGREIDGYEVLSRGKHPDLTDNPNALLQIAERMGLAPQLSRLFRKVALEAVGKRDDLPTLFLNTHPDELLEDCIDFVADLRRLAPQQSLVLEIHETALADPDSIRDLQLLLSEHQIGLAFDDFGAGQARVVQLAEVPPDYLKFDRSFVCGIDTATPSKRHVLSSIVNATRDLGVYTVAEGIESEDEAEMCAHIGFTHAQGYLFGRPIPLAEI